MGALAGAALPVGAKPTSVGVIGVGTRHRGAMALPAERK
jgi:hypothetical protein